MNRQDFLAAIKDRLPDYPMCIEIGVLNGGFSESIIQILKPCILHLVDPWEIGHDKNGNATHYSGKLSHLSTAYSTQDNYTRITNRFKAQIESGSVILHRGYSYDYVDSFEDNTFDFIYIDACHLYESVKADLEMFLPKLKQNGLMCGHDYCNSAIFGVKQAVDEFCINFNFELICKSSTADWALIRK